MSQAKTSLCGGGGGAGAELRYLCEKFRGAKLRAFRAFPCPPTANVLARASRAFRASEPQSFEPRPRFRETLPSREHGAFQERLGAHPRGHRELEQAYPEEAREARGARQAAQAAGREIRFPIKMAAKAAERAWEATSRQ